MEVVGAIASAAQLAVYLLQLSSSIYEQCRRLHKATETFEQYECTIEQFKSVVQLIQSNEWLQTPTVTSVLKVATEKLKKAHDLLPAFSRRTEIVKEKSAKRYWLAFKWLRREKQILAIYSVLEENKSTLILCMQEVQTKLVGNGVAKILDNAPRVDRLHEEISSVRLIVERLTPLCPSSTFANDSFPDQIASETSLTIPKSSCSTIDICSDGKDQLNEMAKADLRETRVIVDGNEPGYKNFPNYLRQSGNIYNGITASGDSRQINGNFSCSECPMRQHRYIRITATDSSCQVNGDVINEGFSEGVSEGP